MCVLYQYVLYMYNECKCTYVLVLIVSRPQMNFVIIFSVQVHRLENVTHRWYICVHANYDVLHKHTNTQCVCVVDSTTDQYLVLGF